MVERGRLGPDAALAFALTGLACSIPALVLPFVTLVKLGRERTVVLLSSAEGLWSQGFGPLGVVVLSCGVLLPVVLLALLVAVIHVEARNSGANVRLRQLVRAVEYWAMPEVQVLGVLVAFIKLGRMIHVTVGPGLWCYGAASFFTLLAWRRFNLQTSRERALSTLAPTSS